MQIIFLLVGLSILMGMASLVAFSWALKSDQFKNLNNDMSQLLELNKDKENAE